MFLKFVSATIFSVVTELSAIFVVVIIPSVISELVKGTDVGVFTYITH
jgi:hypothetical protein